MKQLFSKTTITLRLMLLPLLLLHAVAGRTQTHISGTVIDDKQKPVRGASVYLDNTLDGGTTDSTGIFRFTTTEKGAQTIIASEVGHENAGFPIVVSGDTSGIVLRMKGNKTHNLDQVVITAGSIEANNDNNKTMLKPLDILTTAGANADVVKAIQTLPGTQQQGTQTGLFVRGGDASEAAVLVDGQIAQNAFFSSAPGVASRSRFSPFQFKGVSFSSGGYSARYGQALSSVLELNTLDLPDKDNLNLGINMAGVYASGAKLFKQSSLEASASYNNLQPFYGLANTNFDYYNVPKGGNGSLKYVWKPNKNGILKVMANGSYFTSGVRIPDPFVDTNSTTPLDSVNFALKNTTYYGSVSYKQMFQDKWSLFTAASYSYNKDDIHFGDTPYENTDDRLQYRLEGTRYFNSRLSVVVGTEMQHYSYNRNFDSLHLGYTETMIAGFAEAQWSPVNWLAFKPGIRYEHSELLGQSDVAPRISMAIKTGHYSQVSLAGGIFYQNPDNMYLLYGYRPKFQEAVHYIANYEWDKNDRTLRIEGYYKDYQSLVREHSLLPFDPNDYRNIAPNVTTIDNSGYGYAKGAELFWRDRKSVKNLDYWVSYSYIDTKRLYKNYIAEVTPDFIADHNLNVVTKYFITKWQTNVSATYSYASGRPYYNPAKTDDGNFMSDRTPDFNNLSITVSYLTHIKKFFTVIYAGVDNVTNSHNIFGYRYAYGGTTPYPQVPALYRSVFVGINMSLTQFNKDEL